MPQRIVRMRRSDRSTGTTPSPRRWRRSAWVALAVSLTVHAGWCVYSLQRVPHARATPIAEGIHIEVQLREPIPEEPQRPPPAAAVPVEPAPPPVVPVTAAAPQNAPDVPPSPARPSREPVADPIVTPEPAIATHVPGTGDPIASAAPSPPPAAASPASDAYWLEARSAITRALRLPVGLRSETGITIRLRATAQGFDVIEPSRTMRGRFTDAVRRAAEQAARNAEPPPEGIDPDAYWDIVVKPEESL